MECIHAHAAIRSQAPLVHKYPLAYLLKQHDASDNGILFTQFHVMMGEKPDVHINNLPPAVIQQYRTHPHSNNPVHTSAIYCNQPLKTYLIVRGIEAQTNHNNTLRYVRYEFLFCELIAEIDTDPQWRYSRACTDNILRCVIKTRWFHAVTIKPTAWNYLCDDWGFGIYNQRLLVSLAELLQEQENIYKFLNDIENSYTSANISLLIEYWTNKAPLQTFSFIWDKTGSTSNLLLDTIRVVEQLNIKHNQSEDLIIRSFSTIYNNRMQHDNLKFKITNNSRAIWDINPNYQYVIIPEWLLYVMIGLVFLALVFVMISIVKCCCNCRDNKTHESQNSYKPRKKKMRTLIAQNSENVLNVASKTKGDDVKVKPVQEWKSNQMTKKQSVCDELEPSHKEELFIEGHDEYNTTNTRTSTDYTHYSTYQKRLAEFNI